MNTPKQPKQVCIFVLGMHRSGTSALTRCLNLLGMDLGSHLLSPEKMNAKGFWEHADVVRINDTLLHSYGTYWHSLDPLPSGWLQGEAAAVAREEIRALVKRDFANVPLWGIKDPRMCRLAPLWLEVLQEMQVPTTAVFMTRSPLEVAGSLERTHGLNTSFGVASWMQHLAEAEIATRKIARTMVDYDRLLADPVGVLADIGGALDISWPLPLEDRLDAIHSFLDNGLRTQHKKAVGEEVPLLIRRMISACETIIAAGGDRDNWSELSKLSDEAAEFTDLLGSLDGVTKDGGRPDDKVFATLYSAAGDEPFSEMRASSLELPIGRRQLDFVLPDTSHAPHRFRLDPTDKRGYCVLYSLVLLDSAGRVIWDWSRAPNQVELIGFEQAMASHHARQELLRTANDSQILLHWSDTLSLKDATLRLDIERIADWELVAELENSYSSSVERNKQLIEKLESAEQRLSDHAQREVAYVERIREVESKHSLALTEQARREMSHAEELREIELRCMKEFKDMESSRSSEFAEYDEKLERLDARHKEAVALLESSYGEEIDRLTALQAAQANELEAIRKSTVWRMLVRLGAVLPSRVRKSLRPA